VVPGVGEKGRIWSKVKQRKKERRGGGERFVADC